MVGTPASIFRVNGLFHSEDGGSRFLQDFGIHLLLIYHENGGHRFLQTADLPTNISAISQKDEILIFTAMTTSNHTKLFVLFGNKFSLRCMNFFTESTYKFYSLWILRSVTLPPNPIQNLLSFRLLSKHIQLIL